MTLLASTCLLVSSGRADEITVPITLQIDLLDRVVRYDRVYSAHAREPAVVVIVEKQDTVASARAAAQLSSAIAQSGMLGGRQVSTIVHTFRSPAALRAASRAAAIVYLTPGFSRDETRAIAATFVDSGVLSIGTSSVDVENGMALGFELQSSRPRVVVNLPQARAQRLDFSSQLLRLARIVK